MGADRSRRRSRTLGHGGACLMAVLVVAVCSLKANRLQRRADASQ